MRRRVVGGEGSWWLVSDEAGKNELTQKKEKKEGHEAAGWLAGWCVSLLRFAMLCVCSCPCPLSVGDAYTLSFISLSVMCFFSKGARRPLTVLFFSFLNK